MKAYDVMTEDVVAVGPGATVGEVARLMTERKIGGVPVVDGEGRLLGMVNKGELFMQEQPVPFSTERLPSILNRFVTPEELPEKYRELRHVPVSEVMNKAVVTVDADDDIGRVAETMMRGRVRRVPVTRDGKLCGVISRTDIIHLLAEADERG